MRFLLSFLLLAHGIAHVPGLSSIGSSRCFPNLTYGVQARQVMALGTATRRSVPMGRPHAEHVP